MHPRLALFGSLFVFGGLLAAQQPVTFTSLLREMTDLERLTRWPDPEYRTVQFSSTDRRSVAPDQPGWFANADGFGQEPNPGFEKVLEQPGADGVGEYLVCDVDGPGAIVRGWSAGMDGVLRVWLDGAEKPLFEGKGYDFLARRSTKLVPDFAALPQEVKDLLVQVDSDYLPIPFASHLRVTWTGSIRDLHFYHLQVRRYVAGAKVATFVPTAAGESMRDAKVLAAMQARLRRPLPSAPGRTDDPHRTIQAFDLGADGTSSTWRSEHTEKSPSQLHSFSVTVTWSEQNQAAEPATPSPPWLASRLHAASSQRALRGVLLRIFFDGSQRPQVETPLGDFFATGPGCNPGHSLPLTMTDDDTMYCRWPMPYQRSCRIELVNWSGVAVRGRLVEEHTALDHPFDDRTLYFHAHWRVDHQLSARAAAAPIDLPFLTAIGKGRLVGLACQIVNPPMDPRWRSNWWGEGDEKIFVDGAVAALGTGSEDYFNYAWSRWDLFDHPYCGQPLASGPGNCGYVSNHRFQIMDDLPFTQSLSVAMELWTHKPVSPLSYGRIAYWYARPGALSDHRALQPSDLVVPALQPWRNEDFVLEGDAVSWRAAGSYEASAGKVDPHVPDALVRSGEIVQWQAPAGASLSFPFAVPQDGLYHLRLCLQFRPDAPAVQVQVDGRTIKDGADDTFALQCAHGERMLDQTFDGVSLQKGRHALALLCPKGGLVGVDLLGYELREPAPVSLPGAVEAELWDLVAKSDGTTAEVQQVGKQWSASHQRWVQAHKAGDFAAFRVTAPKPGKYHVTLRLTRSWDYGILRVDWNGDMVAKDVDTFCGAPRALSVFDLDLGDRDLQAPVELKFTVTGSNGKSEAPHHYFGIDCVVLGPVAGR
ncbi:MAG TPA: glycoside hydrolase family 172 protein [Planctomycetota bacterium]|nr:glycoside hydrolase family 172 protein [Planctomycetota bacterium]